MTKRKESILDLTPANEHLHYALVSLRCTRKEVEDTMDLVDKKLGAGSTDLSRTTNVLMNIGVPKDSPISLRDMFDNDRCALCLAKCTNHFGTGPHDIEAEVDEKTNSVFLKLRTKGPNNRIIAINQLNRANCLNMDPEGRALVQRATNIINTEE